MAAGVPSTGAVVSPALEATRRGEALERRTASPPASRSSKLDDRALAELADTEHPQGVVAVIEPRDWSLDDIVLGPPAAPSSSSTPCRIPATWVPCCAPHWPLAPPGSWPCPEPPISSNPKAIRGGMGASFRLPCVATDAETLAAWAATARCRRLGHRRLTAIPCPARPVPRPMLLVVGNEGAGVGESMTAHAARRVGIPLAPGAESLNVAVAAGILLYEVLRAD